MDTFYFFQDLSFAFIFLFHHSFVSNTNYNYPYTEEDANHAELLSTKVENKLQLEDWGARNGQVDFLTTKEWCYRHTAWFCLSLSVTSEEWTWLFFADSYSFLQLISRVILLPYCIKRSLIQKGGPWRQYPGRREGAWNKSSAILLELSPEITILFCDRKVPKKTSNDGEAVHNGCWIYVYIMVSTMVNW